MAVGALMVAVLPAGPAGGSTPGASGGTAAATEVVVTNPGTDPDGRFTFTDATVTIENLDNGNVTTCSGAELVGGEMPSATAPYGQWIGNGRHHHVDCTAPGQDSVEVDSHEWMYAISSYDHVTDRAYGTVFAWVGALIMSPECSYVASFPPDEFLEMDMVYDNQTSTMTVSDFNLVATGLHGTGCGPVVTEGDAMTFTGTFELSPAITIRAA